MNERIKIIYTEDEPLGRKNLILLLKEHGIDCIGEAANGKDLFKLLQQGKNPDLILLDLQMPLMDGNTTLGILKSKYPKIKVVVLTSFEDVTLRNDFIKKGVNAFITKSTDLMQIIDVIKMVCRSDNYRSEMNLSKSNFTSREIEIIPLICKGKTNKQIAEIVGLKEKSIESARKRLYEKTNCNNIVEFTTYCIKRGLEYLGQPLLNG